MTMTRTDVELDLHKLGYSGTLRQMTTMFQLYHGLKPDGVLGEITRREIYEPFRCGMKDLLGEGECKWPTKEVTYMSAFSLEGIPENKVNDAFDEACELWNGKSGLNLSRVDRDPMILALAGRGRRDDFDGPGGTLAWSYMPCGRRASQILQRYDHEERWTYRMLVPVIAHEVGHACGIPHLPYGNLMAPTYNERIVTPQAGDLEELVRRYGLPERPVPPSDPDHPSSPGGLPMPARSTTTITFANGTRLVFAGEGELVPPG